MIKLSILICTISKRKKLLLRLLDSLQYPLRSDLEILINTSNESIGTKRNILLEQAKGKYLCFCDDDDIVCSDYIELILMAIRSNPDCCSLTGQITFDGTNPRIFIHSIEHNSYFEKDNVYYRPPNHLNVIRSTIAKRFKFPEKNFGEDTDWAMQICKSGLLKKESRIDNTLYYYEYITNK